MSEVYLRDAIWEDADMLLEWANNPEVRKSSFHSDVISTNEHFDWYKRMLDDVNTHIYILTDGNTDFGQIRIDCRDDAGYIDYSVAKEQRGHSYGSVMLNMIEKKAAQGNDFCVKKLVGLVKRQNLASGHIFEKCGYEKVIRSDYIEYYRRII